MARTLVLTVLATALLSLALATVCKLVFPDVLSYVPGEDGVMSWQRQIAFLVKATAWVSAEVSGLFAIVLGALLWKRHSCTRS